MIVTPRISILVFVPRLDVGGAQRVLVTLLNYFDRSRLNLHLVVLGHANGELVGQLPKDIAVTYLNKSHVRSSISGIVRLCWRHKPDVIFVNLSYLCLTFSILRPFLPKSASIVARESNIITQNNKAYRFPALWNWLYRTFYHRLDHVICQSEAMRADVDKNFNLDKSQLSVIANPVDIARIRHLGEYKPAKVHNRGKVKNRKASLVAVGGLRAEKNFDGLIRAMALLRDKNFVLDIIGDGIESQMLRNLSAELELGDKVAFHGLRMNPYRTMARADGLVLSSHYEGLPNVVLEALALGTPVISTPAGGVATSLLRGRNGCFLARDASPEALAEALESWLQSTPNRMPEDAADEFAVTRIAHQYEALFKELAH